MEFAGAQDGTPTASEGVLITADIRSLVVRPGPSSRHPVGHMACTLYCRCFNKGQRLDRLADIGPRRA